MRKVLYVPSSHHIAINDLTYEKAYVSKWAASLCLSAWNCVWDCKCSAFSNFLFSYRERKKRLTHTDLCLLREKVFHHHNLPAHSCLQQPLFMAQLQRIHCASWTFQEYVLRANNSCLALHQTNASCYQVAITLGIKWRCSLKYSLVHQRWLTSWFLQGVEIWRKAVQCVRE